ncbi:hypothetical protein P3W45_000695 [Vairimorpha bombi]|jgi:Gti1/Pac2 family transcription factor
MDVLANYIGCLHSEIECSHIINLAMHNNMIRLVRRLNEKEKRMIRPGYGFIYLEEESGIMRWTDSKSWTPSRALGPFMMYIEKRSENPLIKKIYSAKYQGMNVHLVIYNLLNHEETGICCEIYKNIKRTVLPEAYTTMSRCYLKRRVKKEVDTNVDEKSDKYSNKYTKSKEDLNEFNNYKGEYSTYKKGNYNRVDSNFNKENFSHFDNYNRSPENIEHFRDDLYFDRLVYTEIENDIMKYLDKPNMTMYKFLDGKEENSEEQDE